LRTVARDTDRRPHDLFDGAVLLKIGASYLPDLESHISAVSPGGQLLQIGHRHRPAGGRPPRSLRSFCVLVSDPMLATPTAVAAQQSASRAQSRNNSDNSRQAALAQQAY
jgi:hypothetical protein